MYYFREKLYGALLPHGDGPIVLLCGGCTMSGVSIYSHGLGFHNLVARIMGRNGTGGEGMCVVYTC